VKSNSSGELNWQRETARLGLLGTVVGKKGYQMAHSWKSESEQPFYLVVSVLTKASHQFDHPSSDILRRKLRQPKKLARHHQD